MLVRGANGRGSALFLKTAMSDGNVPHSIVFGAIRFQSATMAEPLIEQKYWF